MTEEDAIQEDVSEEVQEEVEQTDAENKPVDTRFDAIEALADRRAEEFDSEVAESREPEEIEEEVEEEPKEELVKVKVDGEEMELPLSEVVKHYQKEATADKRLEQAARERQELEQLRAEIEARNQPQQEEQLPEDTGVDSTTAEKLANAFDDLSVGSDEEKIEAAKVIKELLGGRGDNPAIQEDQIASQAAQQALYQLQYQSAQSKFVEDYQDIVEDPTLYQMAMNVFNEAVPKSQTYDEAFKTAGDAVKQWRDQLISKNSVSDRQALKEQLPKEPSKVSSKANPTPKKKAETAQDIIAAMKASRGQP